MKTTISIELDQNETLNPKDTLSALLFGNSAPSTAVNGAGSTADKKKAGPSAPDAEKIAKFQELFGYYPPKDTEEIAKDEHDKRKALKDLGTHKYRGDNSPCWDRLQ